jgi:hypothetical protein
MNGYVKKSKGEGEEVVKSASNGDAKGKKKGAGKKEKVNKLKSDKKNIDKTLEIGIVYHNFSS